MSLVWPNYQEGFLCMLELNPGQEVSIGRDPKSRKNELIIIDEKSRETYRMGRYNSYVSRIDPKEGKYGSIIIRCNNDRSIEIARAPGSVNPVEVVYPIYALPEGKKQTQIMRPYRLNEGDRIILSEASLGKCKVWAIYVPSIDSEEVDPLIAYLFIE